MTLAGGERGLLGFAFSPDGSHLYVDYTDTRRQHQHRRVRGRPPTAPSTPPPAARCCSRSSRSPNHNGGQVIFGPDGYLYIGFGDGGSAGDPQRNGLEPRHVARQDPAHRPARQRRPALHRAGRQPVRRTQAGAKPEIWSYGAAQPVALLLRPRTGDLWIGDVGQGNIEEVDRATVADGAGKGANFGWSAFEGTRPLQRRPVARRRRRPGLRVHATRTATARSPAATSTAAPPSRRCRAPTCTPTTAGRACGRPSSMPPATPATPCSSPTNPAPS